MSPLRWRRMFEFLLLCLWGCSSPQSLQAFESTPLRIASFNIQVFGQEKISNPVTLETLTHILSRYDLTFVQEIRDSSNNAIYELLDRLNARTKRNFKVLLSERLGRSVSKEQYAFIYDEAKIAPLDAFTYPDSKDEFEREPYIGRFRSGNTDFTLVGVHVTPRGVEQELRALRPVHHYVKEKYQSPDMIIMGDLNADCDYYDQSKGFQYFEETVQEMLPRGTDTTVAPSTCTYDRVLAFGSMARWAKQATAFRFAEVYTLSDDQAKDVSDHYPVEFTLGREVQGAEPAQPVPPSQPTVPDEPSTTEPPVQVPEPSPAPKSEDSVAQPEMPMPSPVDSSQTSSASQCGLNPHRTPRGYCYASFGDHSKRVSATCCPVEDQALISPPAFPSQPAP